MALDEPNSNDKIHEIDGFKYIVNKDLLEKAQTIKVDFLEVGFKLTSNLDFDASASACGSCSTTGSCCST